MSPKFPPPPPLPSLRSRARKESDPPVNLDGTVKLRIVTLFGIVAVLWGVMLTYSKMASKDDIGSLIQQHNVSLDSHPQITQTLASVTASTSAMNARTSVLELRSAEMDAKIDKISDRVDFLVEQTVREAATRSPARPAAAHAGERAVQRLRSSGDPAGALGVH